ETLEFILSDCGSHCTIEAPPVPGYYTLQLGERQLKLAIAPTAAAARAGLAHRRDWAMAVQLYALRHRGDGGIGSYSALAELAAPAAAAGAQGLAVSPVHAGFSADAGHFSPYS